MFFGALLRLNDFCFIIVFEVEVLLLISEVLKVAPETPGTCLVPRCQSVTMLTSRIQSLQGSLNYRNRPKLRALGLCVIRDNFREAIALMQVVFSGLGL